MPPDPLEWHSNHADNSDRGSLGIGSRKMRPATATPIEVKILTGDAAIIVPRPHKKGSQARAIGAGNARHLQALRSHKERDVGYNRLFAGMACPTLVLAVSRLFARICRTKPIVIAHFTRGKCRSIKDCSPVTTPSLSVMATSC